MRLKAIIGALILVLLGSTLFTLSLFYNLGGASSSDPYTIEITRGGSFRQAAKKLEAQGTISGVNRFIILAKLLGKTQELKWGEYEFTQRPGHPIDILRQITEGDLKKYKITIPEGYNVLQIAELLEYRELLKSEDFEQYALSESSAQAHNVPGPTLEGYLFPTTYFLRKGMQANEIAEEMVAQYRQLITPKFRSRMKELELSERETVILASIIEKETSIEGERPRISAVFHNRLNKKMRLQADPTVIYGINDFDGNITKEHLNTYTPYNTYRVKGLPPGPIANPGKRAIEAALYPEKSDFLYFVADREGGHDFSRTYKEHYEKVLKYQVRKR